MKRKLIHIAVLIFTLSFSLGCSESDHQNYEQEVVIDIDGNAYNTIKIGNQIWMTENLKTTRLNDGTPISEFRADTDSTDWSKDENPKLYYRWSDTRDINNLYINTLPHDFYGAFYNETTISSGRLAPEGYRIPTLNDYLELINYLSEEGYSFYEAQALKSSTGWIKNVGNGSNSFQFNALPNGFIHENGEVSGTEGVATLATNTFSSNGTQVIVKLSAENEVQFITNGIVSGGAVRCIKE